MNKKKIFKFITSLVTVGTIFTGTTVFIFSSRSFFLNQNLFDSINSNLIKQEVNFKSFQNFKKIFMKVIENYEKFKVVDEFKYLEQFNLKNKEDFQKLNNKIDLIIKYVNNNEDKNKDDLIKLPQSEQEELANFLNSLFKKSTVNGSTSNSHPKIWINELISIFSEKIDKAEFEINIQKLITKFVAEKITSKISVFMNFSDFFMKLKITKLNMTLPSNFNYEKFLKIFRKSDDSIGEFEYEIDEMKLNKLTNKMIKIFFLYDFSEFKKVISKLKNEWDQILILKITLTENDLSEAFKYIEEIEDEENKSGKITELNTILDPITYSQLMSWYKKNNALSTDYIIDTDVIERLDNVSLNAVNKLNLTTFLNKIKEFKKIDKQKILIKTITDAVIGDLISYVETLNPTSKQKLITNLNTNLSNDLTYASLIRLLDTQNNYATNNEVIKNLTDIELIKWDNLNLTDFKAQIQSWKDEEEKRTTLKETLNDANLAELLQYVESLDESIKTTLINDLDLKLGDSRTYAKLIQLFGEDNNYQINNDAIDVLTGNDLDIWDTFDLTNFKIKIDEHKNQKTLTIELEKDGIIELIKFFEKWEDKSAKENELDVILGNNVSYLNLKGLFDSTDWTVDENVINALSGDSLDKWDGLDLTNFKAKIQEWKDEYEKQTILKETINEAGLSTLLAYVESLSDTAKATLINTLNLTLGDEQTYAKLIQLLNVDINYQANEVIIKALTGDELTKWDNLDLTEFKAKIETHKKQTALKKKLKDDGEIAGLIKNFQEFFNDNQEKIDELNGTLNNGLTYNDLLNLFTKNSDDTYSLNELAIFSLEGEELTKWNDLDLINFKAKINEQKKQQTLKEKLENADLKELLKFFEIWDEKVTKKSELDTALGESISYSDMIGLFDSVDWTVDENVINALSGESLTKWDGLDLTNFKAKIQEWKDEEEKRTTLKETLNDANLAELLISFESWNINDKSEKITMLDNLLGDDITYINLKSFLNAENWTVNENVINELSGDSLDKWDGLDLTNFKTKLTEYAVSKKRILLIIETKKLKDKIELFQRLLIQKKDGYEAAQTQINNALPEGLTFEDLKSLFAIDGDSGFSILKENEINQLMGNDLDKWTGLNGQAIIDIINTYDQGVDKVAPAYYDQIDNLIDFEELKTTLKQNKNTEQIAKIDSMKIIKTVIGIDHLYEKVVWTYLLDGKIFKFWVTIVVGNFKTFNVNKNYTELWFQQGELDDLENIDTILETSVIDINRPRPEANKMKNWPDVKKYIDINLKNKMNRYFFDTSPA